MAELKELVRQNTKLSQETKQMVEGMRRSQRRHVWFRILWWVAITVVSAVAYYYYVQPYVDQILHAYGNAKDFQLQVQDFFAQFGRTKTN